jgi:FSR family fosmidomycin resistance protein-like MFS transporter
VNSPALLLFILSFGHLCTDFVQGSLPALLPFLKDAFGLSYTGAGMLLMATHMTSSVIQPLFGYFTDRRPFPFLLPLGLGISGIGIALVPFAPSVGWLVTFVMFTGLGTAAFHPEGFKATACITSERRATGMALFSVGGNLGFGIGGPVAILLVSRYGLHGASALLVPAAAAALLSVFALPAIRDRIRSIATAPRARTTEGSDRPFYTVTLIVLIVVLRSWTQLGLATYIPFLYESKLATDPAYVGTLLFLFLGAGTMGTVLGGPLADRFGHRRFLFTSIALQVPLVFLFLHSGGWLVFLMVALLGATIISSFSVTIVMAQELFPKRLATASGTIAGFAIGTGGIGVTLLGVAADRYGVPAAVNLINAFPVAGALLALLLPLPWKSLAGGHPVDPAADIPGEHPPKAPAP